MEKGKVKAYVAWFLVTSAAVIFSTWAIQQWNKPRTAPPKTSNTNG